MSRERFEESLAFVLRWEGSRFTNDPSDRGGATRFGITQTVYDDFRRRRGLPGRSVRQITMDEVRDIYRRQYWDAVQGDALPVPLDVVAFDTGVLMGVGRSVRLLQQSLNVTADGDLGPRTRAALAAHPAPSVARRFTDLREARLHAIVAANPTQRRFLRGWLNRLNDLRRVVERGGVLSEIEEAEGGEELRPDEAATVGRASADLTDDFPQQEEVGPEEQPRLSFFETTGVAPFVRAAAPVLDFAQQPRFVIDLAASGEDSLMVSSGQAGSPYFELPAVAVEALIPLGLRGGDPTQVSAAFIFRPEFRSFAAELVRARAASNGGQSPGEENYAAASGSAASGVCEQDEAGADFAGGDLDPASPTPADLRAETSLDFDAAQALADYGAVEPDSSRPAFTTELEVVEGLSAEVARPAAAATIALNIGVSRSFLDACTGSSPRVRYGLGKKVPFHGATPGRHFTRVDCSGFVREAIWRATNPHLNFPDGSVVQHDWVRARGFTRHTVRDALLRDGAVRIAFLRPQDAPRGVGHVALVHNARTLESHGGTGPNSRPWTAAGWQARAFVYLLTPPQS